MKTMIAAALLITAAAESLACSCPPPPPGKGDTTTADRLGYVPAVFVAKVVRMKVKREKAFNRGYPFRETRVRVERAWKGVRPGRTMTLRTELWESACGLSVEKGDSWLFFARWSERDSSLVSGLCDGSKRLDQAGRLVAELDSLAGDIEEFRKP